MALYVTFLFGLYVHAVPTTANNCCSSTESPSKALPLVETIDQGSNNHPLRGDPLIYLHVLQIILLN